jgi:hypothetical protein
MMMEFSRHIEAKTGKPFCPDTRRLRCLAHIINLATQAVLSTYSKSKHFSPETADAELVADNGFERDEVGIVRAITVKERSSAKRKQLFRDIQALDGQKVPLQLLMDMPVRWSSTFIMLERAEHLKAYVDRFVIEMAREEKDRAKRQKLDALQLTPEEWQRVKLFLDLLAVRSPYFICLTDA